jgi:hypothetical protein
MALASLANDATGDPHALDHGRTIGGIVLDAVAPTSGRRPRTPWRPRAAEAEDAEAARSLWELVGVVPDPTARRCSPSGCPIAEASSGWTGPPLVCTSGRPTIAAATLLRRLASDGAVIYQHADFDPTGLALTGWLAERAGGVAWRMTATDHLGWLSVSEPGFAGTPPEAPWDPALQVALSHHGKRSTKRRSGRNCCARCWKRIAFRPTRE